jgi:hypothetical protein
MGRSEWRRGVCDLLFGEDFFTWMICHETASFPLFPNPGENASRKRDGGEESRARREVFISYYWKSFFDGGAK